MKLLIIISALVSLALTDDINSRYFPSNFKFGVSTSAAQTEGAWNEDGKGESIWDRFVHTFPAKIIDRSTSDISSDAYHKYKDDVALAKQMGLDYYRFSIAWSRILPSGYTDEVNQAGVDYYKNLITELKANEIEPIVTLYHLDLPQALEENLGGWLDTEIVQIFADYANLCFELFGDDVKMWITINSPSDLCQTGYGTGMYAPGVISDGIGNYICARNVILAHATTYHNYNDNFRDSQGGRIAMAIDSLWYEPGSDGSRDTVSAERILQFTFGLYAEPLFQGTWPENVIDRITMRSKLEGCYESRLTQFSEEEQSYVNQTYDFLALNHYTTHMINATNETHFGKPSYYSDISVTEWQQPEWTSGAQEWFSVVPWGLRKLLVWLKNTYGDVEIVITENGFPGSADTLEDDDRIDYIQNYLSNCLDAIYEDEVNVTAYLVRSLIDDWDWNRGFTSAFGMYQVNFSDPERTRTPRKSATFFTNIVKNRCLVDECTDSV